MDALLGLKMALAESVRAQLNITMPDAVMRVERALEVHTADAPTVSSALAILADALEGIP